MLLFIRSLLFNILFFLCSFLFCGVGFVVLLFPRKFVVWYARMWSKSHIIILKMVGISHRLEGQPSSCAIYAIRHESSWETVVLGAIFNDPAIILKKELMYVPFFGFFLKKLKMIFVDRNGGHIALKSLVKDVKKYIADGRPVTIFPEGTRRAYGEYKQPEVGIVALYKSAGVPIIPVYLDSGRFWPRRSFIKKPGVITVKFFDPIPEGLSKDDFLKALMEAFKNDKKNH